jgi:2,5-diamino-6-(ribosylamino)-4(3H)-pyrimidinone 5'-phosphate reductase
LSARLQEKEEKILEVLERLSRKNADGTPVIVEGKKDVTTLRALGIEGRLIEAKTGGKTLLEVIFDLEKSGAQEVILLLDFDRRGRELTKRLKQYLEKTRTKPNLFFWEELLNMIGREVKDVEGLMSYMRTLRRKLTGIS